MGSRGLKCIWNLRSVHLLGTFSMSMIHCRKSHKNVYRVFWWKYRQWLDELFRGPFPSIRGTVFWAGLGVTGFPYQAVSASPQNPSEVCSPREQHWGGPGARAPPGRSGAGSRSCWAGTSPLRQRPGLQQDDSLSRAQDVACCWRSPVGLRCSTWMLAGS